MIILFFRTNDQELSDNDSSSDSDTTTSEEGIEIKDQTQQQVK